MKVLFIIDHAPDYRESFFRGLSEHCDLTVFSHPCEPDGLTAPDHRKGYQYVEVPIHRKGPFFLLADKTTPAFSEYDVLCVDFNPRHLWRIRYFLQNKSQWNKWVWWGHIYGKSNNYILEKVRLFVLKRSVSVLAYSETIAEHLKIKLKDTPVISINNTQVKKSDFINLSWPSFDQLKFIFVGRPQERKRLDRIVKLAEWHPLISWRLIGPDMEEFMQNHFGELPDNIECFGKTTGDELTSHFEWCHAVANPGHMGLLVSNAAKHGRPVIVQENERHAPEIILAQEAEQPFINFDSKSITEAFFSNLLAKPKILKEAGQRLQATAKQSYTIENMVEKHLEGFRYAIDD
jgi:glycosyltransferase involved in cell wall biosynthesis